MGLFVDWLPMGASLSDAARQIAKETGYRKGELYRQALEAE